MSTAFVIYSSGSMKGRSEQASQRNLTFQASMTTPKPEPMRITQLVFSLLSIRYRRITVWTKTLVTISKTKLANQRLQDMSIAYSSVKRQDIRIDSEMDKRDLPNRDSSHFFLLTPMRYVVLERQHFKPKHLINPKSDKRIEKNIHNM